MLKRCLGCMEEHEFQDSRCPNCGYIQDTEVERPLHMTPGLKLHGRFLVGRVLGYGGFGVTYIGWDLTLQQKVAIKEYLPSELATRMGGQTQVTVFGGNKREQFGTGIEQFVKEAQRLHQLQNAEGVVRILDSFQENNTAYIVMEYLEGETLTARLDREGKLDPKEAIELLLPVLDSLENIHQQSIIHRDIAPDNIFLTKDGQAKLIDFGAARYATTSHSRSLSVIIKPGYSPEEQYRSQSAQGPYTDVYALAAVLYRAITGTVPPDSMERRAIFEKSGKDPLQDPTKLSSIDKGAGNAIMNALNIRAEDRTATASLFRKELEEGAKPKKAKGGKWPLWLKMLLPAAGIAAIALLVLLSTGVIGPSRDPGGHISLSQTEARVPSVVNYSVDVARATLAELGLECQIVGTQYSDSLPANVVLYQSVAPGQVVEKNTVIGIYISTDTGGDTTEGQMPFVQYTAYEEAKALLESLGLIVLPEEVYSSSVPEGMVASQSLDAETEIKKGDTVTLQVSKGPDPDAPTADIHTVVLSQESFELYLGDTIPMVAHGGNGKYTYETSDPTILSISADGTITAAGAGTATVTVRSGSAKEATCTITVSDYTIAIAPGELKLFVSGNTSLAVSGIPTGATLEWTSADSAIATVDAEGKVTGVASGTTTVTVTWINGQKTYTATSAVIVDKGGITLSESSIGSFYVGQTRTLTATTSPADQTVTWKSSNEKVVTVSSDGKITAVGGGSATITASFGENTASCKVTVTQPSVALTKSSLSLTVGDTSRLSATVVPSGTSVKWSSDDSGIAKVSDGKVTAVSAGTTTIRVKVTYEGKTYSDSCKVTVTKKGSTSTTNPTTKPTTKPNTTPTTPKPAVKLSVSLNNTSVSMTVGNTQTLKATVSPNGTKVSWSSSDNSVAKVDSNGKVTAVGAGSATITATITSGGNTAKATCKVTVSKPSISLSSHSERLTYAEREQDRGTVKLTATVKPDKGDVNWSISDRSVATISSKGTSCTITAKSSGTATVTATYTVNGTTVKDTCEVTVKPAGSTLKISNIKHPTQSTLSDFYFSADISSNYQLTKIFMSGKAKSNKLGLSVSDSATFTFVSGVYETTPEEAELFTIFLKGWYGGLYKLYNNTIGALLNDSLTVTAHATVYDSSGATYSFDITYVLED